MERNKHGFNFEEYIIKKYALNKSNQYLASFDAMTIDEIPVQIKTTKKGGEICLASFNRNIQIDSDFILIIGFWETKNVIIEEFIFYVKKNKWKELLSFEHIEIMTRELDNISNDKKDDEKFKQYRNKINKLWGDRIIKLRFKRDHKNQKRIQLAVPAKNIEIFFDCFDPYLIREGDMKNENKLSNNLDQFYTQKKIARKLLKKLFDLVDINSDVGFIEPSAGTGSFSNVLRTVSNYVLAIDIDPRGDGIEEGDFLKETFELFEGRNIVVGNPPFGKNASLAIKFFNKAASYDQVDLIAFILPCSFRKESIQKRLNNKFHLLHDIEMNSASFIFRGGSYEVPCCFMIWERRSENRATPIKYSVKTSYSFCSFQEANVTVRRVGANAGLFTEINGQKEFSSSSHYFILFNVEYDIEKLNSIIWERDNTVGPRSISKNEIIKKLNEIF